MLQLDFNVTSPVTMRQAARQAIAHMIDRSALLDRVFGAIDPSLVVNQDHLAVVSQPIVPGVVGSWRVHRPRSGARPAGCSSPSDTIERR